MAINKGAGAIGALNAEQGGGDGAEITSFKSGTTLKVRVKGTEDVASYYNYGIYKKVNSFVPKEPATRNARGFVESGHTPWDKAAQYYQDKAQATKDKTEQEALKEAARLYRGKEKFLLGFHDLTTGKDIVIDLTKAQAKSVHATIVKYEKKLGKLAFELSKQGESTGTTVSLSPLIDMDEDLSTDEKKAFDAATEPFNADMFDGVLYEMDEADQIDSLVNAGFDLSLIGLEKSEQSDGDDGKPIDINDDDLPF